MAFEWREMNVLRFKYKFILVVEDYIEFVINL